MATTAPSAAIPPVGGGAARRPHIFHGYWIVVAAFIALFVSVGTQTYVIGVMFKPMTEEFGWSRTDFTYAQTVGRFLMAFAGFVIGGYVDRFGGRVLMLIGATILGSALWLTSGVDTLWQWIALSGVVFTVGAALMGNLVVNVALAKWFVEKRGWVVSLAALGISVAGMLMPLLVTVWIDAFGWRSAWRMLAVLAWSLAYPAALLMRRQPEDYGLHPDGRSDAEVAAGRGAAAAADYANSFTRREALRTRAFYMVVFAFGLSGVALGTVLLQAIPFLTDEGFSPSTAAVMVSSFSVVSGLSKPAWGLLLDRRDPRRLAAASFVVTGASLNLMVIGATAQSVPVVTSAFLLFGLGVGGTLPLQEVIWATFFGRRYLGAVRSVAMPFSLVLGAGGPLVVSVYFDIIGDYHGAFFAISALSLLGAAVMLLSQRPQKPTLAATEPAHPAPADTRSG